jgi:hypothetical protein
VNRRASPGDGAHNLHDEPALSTQGKSRALDLLWGCGGLELPVNRQTESCHGQIAHKYQPSL